MPRLFAPIPASMVELVVVWAWHAPALHHAARQESVGARRSSRRASRRRRCCCGSRPSAATREQRAPARGAGIVALLLTSMHMTLLGALFALAPRPLYRTHAAIGCAAVAARGSALGGAIMLLVGCLVISPAACG